MKKTLVFILFFVAVGIAEAQELNCKVTINSNGMKSNQQTDKSTINELEKSITEFLNNQRWTSDNFNDDEKIECTLLINLLQSPSQNVFEGNASFTVFRPVFGTSYSTKIFQYVDKNFNVSFAPSERQMIYNEQSYSNNLTSTLAFYALTALQTDYDSFEKLGGTPFVERLYNLANLAEGTDAGWSRSGSSLNRYNYIENLRNQQFNKLRENFYTYHRLGLDMFFDNSIKSREITLDFLKVISETNSKVQNSILINSLLDAKAEEFVGIFKEGTLDERSLSYGLLRTLDPTRNSLYQNITK